MSAAIRTVDSEFGSLEYDSDMPMGVLKGLLGAANSGDLDTLMENFSKFITKWPFKNDPTDAKSWDLLRRSEFNAVITAIMEDLGKLGEA